MNWCIFSQTSQTGPQTDTSSQTTAPAPTDPAPAPQQQHQQQQQQQPQMEVQWYSGWTDVMRRTGISEEMIVKYQEVYKRDADPQGEHRNDDQICEELLRYAWNRGYQTLRDLGFADERCARIQSWVDDSHLGGSDEHSMWDAIVCFIQNATVRQYDGDSVKQMEGNTWYSSNIPHPNRKINGRVLFYRPVDNNNTPDPIPEVLQKLGFTEEAKIQYYYHGTDLNSAMSIIVGGIDIKKSRPNLDFFNERAFYVTNEFGLAVKQARDKAKLFGGEPIVLWFALDENLIHQSTPHVEYKRNSVIGGEPGHYYKTVNVNKQRVRDNSWRINWADHILACRSEWYHTLKVSEETQTRMVSLRPKINKLRWVSGAIAVIGSRDGKKVIEVMYNNGSRCWQMAIRSNKLAQHFRWSLVGVYYTPLVNAEQQEDSALPARNTSPSHATNATPSERIELYRYQLPDEPSSSESKTEPETLDRNSSTLASHPSSVSPSGASDAFEPLRTSSTHGSRVSTTSSATCPASSSSSGESSALESNTATTPSSQPIPPAQPAQS